MKPAKIVVDNLLQSRLIVLTLTALLCGCVSVPSGKAKVDMIDQLVAQQEFDRIRYLLNNIDTRDPEFEALVVRRRAIRPLIAQFEEYTVTSARRLQNQDRWPEALGILRDAQSKLSDSAILEAAETSFFEARAKRLAEIQHQIGLLEGQNQADIAPLVDRLVSIHPTGIRSRWQHFRHQRKNRVLAEDLMGCGATALQRGELALAEACFSMVRALSDQFDVDTYFAEINQQKLLRQQQAHAVAEAQAQQRKQRAAQQVARLKEQYRHLAAAQWLAPAKQTLVELRLLAPQDTEVLTWAKELQAAIDDQVAKSIREGQALYSHGQLQQALDTWQGAAQLDPDNPVLQGHIARAERFIDKLERLNNNKI